MSSEVVLLVTIRTKPGRRDELVELLAAHIEFVSSSEPGVRFTAAHTSAEEPEAIILYERYADDEALAQHREHNATNPRYQAFLERLGDLLAAPIEVRPLDLVVDFSR